MAELIFFTGPMDCGKSTLALQLHHTQSAHDRSGDLFTSQDRAGRAVVTSRIGLQHEAFEVGPEFNFVEHVVAGLTQGRRIDFLVCDEAQFYSRDQVDQLAQVVDDLTIDVFAFGILADFRTTLFPGSQRLVELADKISTLQVQPLCWCGRRATHNARTSNGVMVTQGSQVVVGDIAEDRSRAISYEVLCRKHHRMRMTNATQAATLSPEVLPFEEET